MNAFEESLTTYFGREGLKKIQATRVGIAGLGGLGSNCAMALVRCGFRSFVPCDFDRVETGNLNRQWYFLDQVGELKPEALRTNLLRINSDLDLVLVPEKVTPENASRLFGDCDAIVEAFDKPENKKMLLEAFWGSDKFFVSASGLAGWGDSDSIVTRSVKQRIVMIGDHKSQASGALPPCAPRVLVAAAKEADALLSWVLGPAQGPWA